MMNFLFGSKSNSNKPTTTAATGTTSSNNSSSSAATSSKTRKLEESSTDAQFIQQTTTINTLGHGNLKSVVTIPEGVDLNEWIAIHIFNFFHQINMLYDTLSEFCTEQACPTMSAGTKFEYQWTDGQTKKTIKCAAPRHINYLMDWVQNQLDNEQLFPTIAGNAFPKNFLQVSKSIFERVFRVFAHIYCEHYQQIVQLNEDTHLNTSFKHFILFSNEFSLIDKKDLTPLQDLIAKF